MSILVPEHVRLWDLACLAASRARHAEIAGDDALVAKCDAEYMDYLLRSNDAWAAQATDIKAVIPANGEK